MLSLHVSPQGTKPEICLLFYFVNKDLYRIMKNGSLLQLLFTLLLAIVVKYKNGSMRDC